MPLGEGVCEEEEPKATRDFSGVARVEEARRGAPESSGAPTTEETRRDASSSPDRRGRAGDRRSVLGDVRARIFEGARRGMRPPRVVFRTNYRSHFFSDVFWAVSAEFVCFFPPFLEREKTGCSREDVDPRSWVAILGATLAYLSDFIWKLTFTRAT